MTTPRDASIDVDTSSWPLMVVTMPPVEITEAAVEEFIDGQRKILQRREKHAALSDATRARPVNARLRRRLAEWLEEAKPLNGAYTVAMAIVIDNALVRGGLTAVLWLAQPACPTKVFATVEEAMDFCIDALRKAGVPGVEAIERRRAQMGVRTAAR